MITGDDIAKCVLKTFDALPKKAKPREYPDGSREWVPLSGIVLCLDGNVNAEVKEDCSCVDREVKQNGHTNGHKDRKHQLHCVALGTGMRCLPASKVPLAHGRCLHDWHAEVVAMRAFNLFLLEECSKQLGRTLTPSFVHRIAPEKQSPATPQPFAVNDNVRIFMYCSEAPCGDASMELIMDQQDDATPWVKRSTNEESDTTLRGRGFFSDLGIVRRKPARSDAPETLSKSCSDKLSMRQCTSLLCSVTSTVIQPNNVYIHSLVLPASQHVESAMNRAFSPSGRMSSLTSENGALPAWDGGYSYRPFQALSTTEEFCYSRQNVKPGTKTPGSNITAMWTPESQEVLIGGSITGLKQFSVRGASKISKSRLWSLAATVAHDSHTTVTHDDEAMSYADFKTSASLTNRRKVKDDVRTKALLGWVRNEGGDDFALKEGQLAG